jgi:hypothetical protein
MKKVLLTVLVCFFVILFSCLVFAEGDQEGVNTTAAPEMKHEGMPGPAAMMMEHGKKMMGMMGGKSMVATSDGGVVILFGHKLQKYDKNLVLQKEVEIKIDKEAMLNKMKCSKMAEKKAQEDLKDKKEEKAAESSEPMGMPASDIQ